MIYTQVCFDYICKLRMVRDFILNHELYQIIVAILSTVFIVRIVIQFANNQRSILSTGVWSFFWILLGILAIAPDLMSIFLAKVLGFKDNVHGILFMGLGLSFLIIFYLSSAVDILETRMHKLVRTLAIREAELQELQELQDSVDEVSNPDDSVSITEDSVSSVETE